MSPTPATPIAELQEAQARSMAELLKTPIIVIDPEDFRCFTIPNLTEQQLEALEDCDYICIHPLLNLKFHAGAWEPIVIGQMSQDSSVILVRAL